MLTEDTPFCRLSKGCIWLSAHIKPTPFYPSSARGNGKLCCEKSLRRTYLECMLRRYEPASYITTPHAHRHSEHIQNAEWHSNLFYPIVIKLTFWISTHLSRLSLVVR